MFIFPVQLTTSWIGNLTRSIYILYIERMVKFVKQSIGAAGVTKIIEVCSWFAHKVFIWYFLVVVQTSLAQ